MATRPVPFANTSLAGGGDIDDPYTLPVMNHRASGPSLAGTVVGAIALLVLVAAPVGCGDGAAPSGGRSADSDGAPGAARQQEAEAAPGPSGPSARPVQGVDVSHFSGAVDWSKVAEAGYDFAYVKATEGVDSPDPLFREHWEALAATGLHRGAYHFYVTEDDPEEQARFFLETVGHRPGDLVPVVDVEVIGHGTRPGLPDRLRRFLELLEEALGVRPMIYTSPRFWDAHLAGDFSEHPLWVAEYGVDEPAVPAGWETWHLWQWRGDASVPGVEKDADVSRLHPERSLEDLRIPASAR